MDDIRLRGVRVHNLRGVDLEIPRGKLTVFTGVSGSGKSSLAFDTLYAEGQRRYVESLSTYARQFLERMDRPDADLIEGIPPAIAIQQRTPTTGGRSTVGTVTEIHDYLRLLWARIGKPHCLRCALPVEKDTVERVSRRFIERSAGARMYVCFPVDASLVLKTVSADEFLDEVRANGFHRIRLNGRILTLEEAAGTRLTRRSRLQVVVDRLTARAEARQRLSDSIETAYRFGHGRCLVVTDDGTEHPFSQDLHCAVCDLDVQPPVPALFSFNSPLGACPACQGFGRSIELDPDLIIPDRSLTLRQRPVEAWNTPAYGGMYEEMFAAARSRGIPLDVPYRRMKAAHRKWVENGDDEFTGIAGFFGWLESKSYKVHVRVFMSRFRTYRTCETCGGQRLRPEALAVRTGGLGIAAVSAMSVAESRRFLETIGLSPMEEEIAGPILQELRRRLDYLLDVGLEYLTLDRLSRTLSGGEAQRIHLATALGSGLVGTLYILDEPSIGLHPRDNERLIRILATLRDLGNTVVVVEHDPALIRSADRLVDFGPGAGEGGGTIVAVGTPGEVAACGESLTGRYLAGEKTVPAPGRLREPGPAGWIVVEGARANNLKEITVRFPLGLLCCVTGVSGSGKSSLVQDTLYPALRRAKGDAPREIGPHAGLTGADSIRDVVLVDQSPVGKSPRSNPVTYIGAFGDIRKAFAETRDAGLRGISAGDLSFNRPGGRCESCRGMGFVTAEMHFLADVTLTCEACGGTRYGEAALAVKLRGRSIADVLSMTATEAITFFEDRPSVVSRLDLLEKTGLGYLRLGQPVSTLSGGEAQRLKLAEAISHGRGGALYLFDEPTTGLHLEDVRTLLACLDRLIERGHSVIVIEHHLDVIRSADWIIDLGPGAADEGGRVVAAGPPATIAACPDSLTGRFIPRPS